MRIATLLIVFFLGCGEGDRNPPFKGKLVPDDTPFVVATMEFSPDTLESFPEVFVATVKDTQDPYYLFPDHIEAQEVANAVHTPMMWGQVMVALENLHFRPTPIATAEVTLKGPIGDADEATLKLNHYKAGFYRDAERKMKLLAGKEYVLEVKFPDNRTYRSATSFPKLFEINIPDTVQIPVKIGQRSDGSYYEQHKAKRYLIGNRPDDAFFSVEGTAFTPNPYVHNYACRDKRLSPFYCYFFYGVDNFPQNQIADSTFIYWSESSYTPIKNFEVQWHSVKFLNSALQDWYQVERPQYGLHAGDSFHRGGCPLSEATYGRDKSFLPKVSNWYKLDANGNVLPKEQSDAIGVFGAYTSRYKRTKLIPIRDFKPCDYNWKGCPNNP